MWSCSLNSDQNCTQNSARVVEVVGDLGVGVHGLVGMFDIKLTLFCMR